MSWYKRAQYNQYGVPLDFEEKVHSPLYDDLISDKLMNWYDNETQKRKSGPVKDFFREVKGYDAKIENMSPDEYIDICVNGFYGRGPNFNFDEAKKYLIDNRRMSQTLDGTSLIESYKDRWINGQNPPMGFLEYSRSGEFYGQEGLHRAIMAKDMGISLIPVLVVRR